MRVLFALRGGFFGRKTTLLSDSLLRIPGVCRAHFDSKNAMLGLKTLPFQADVPHLEHLSSVRPRQSSRQSRKAGSTVRPFTDIGRGPAPHAPEPLKALLFLHRIPGGVESFEAGILQVDSLRFHLLLDRVKPSNELLVRLGQKLLGVESLLAG